METVPLELPGELVRLAQLDTDNLSHETAKVLALDLFRERKVSIGRAAELCETPLAAFMDFAAAHGVPPLSYDLENLEHDRAPLPSCTRDLAFGADWRQNSNSGH